MTGKRQKIKTARRKARRENLQKDVEACVLQEKLACLAFRELQNKVLERVWPSDDGQDQPVVQDQDSGPAQSSKTTTVSVEQDLPRKTPAKQLEQIGSAGGDNATDRSPLKNVNNSDVGKTPQAAVEKKQDLSANLEDALLNLFLHDAPLPTEEVEREKSSRDLLDSFRNPDNSASPVDPDLRKASDIHRQVKIAVANDSRVEIRKQDYLREWKNLVSRDKKLTDPTNSPFLRAALKQNSSDLIRMVRECKAPKNCRCERTCYDYKTNPLLIAAESDFYQLVHDLYNEAGTNAHMEALVILWNSSRFVNTVKKRSDCCVLPYQTAVMNGHTRTARALLSVRHFLSNSHKSEAQNVFTPHQTYPFSPYEENIVSIAASTGDVQLLKDVMREFPRICENSHYAQQILREAAASGSVDCMYFLFNNYDDKSKKLLLSTSMTFLYARREVTTEMDTALHFAVANDDLEMVKVLLRANVGLLAVPDVMGRNAVTIAQMNHCQKVADFFMESRAPYALDMSFLTESIAHRYSFGIRQILSNWPETNQETASTPLLTAISMMNWNTVEQLLRNIFPRVAGKRWVTTDLDSAVSAVLLLNLSFEKKLFLCAVLYRAGARLHRSYYNKLVDSLPSHVKNALTGIELSDMNDEGHHPSIEEKFAELELQERVEYC